MGHFAGIRNGVKGGRNFPALRAGGSGTLAGLGLEDGHDDTSDDTPP